ncbi:MAG: hypothetical protein H6670_14695 [Anaerolineaceae bacterium]|nr:hypothetical protein [Anaerolineaceae bacterium]
MRKFVTIPVLVLMLIVASACQTIGTANDATSAQRFLPNIVGYTATDADSLVDAITTAGAGAALTSGNIPAIAAIQRADAMIQCLQETGSIAGKVYTQDQWTDIVPEAGVSIVVNRTRVNQNVIACLSSTGGGLTTQSVRVEPCARTGDFTVNGEDFTYIYVGVGNNICGLFQLHFNNVQANNAQ